MNNTLGKLWYFAFLPVDCYQNAIIEVFELLILEERFFKGKGASLSEAILSISGSPPYKLTFAEETVVLKVVIVSHHSYFIWFSVREKSSFITTTFSSSL